jgi:hypothetical protein
MVNLIIAFTVAFGFASPAAQRLEHPEPTIDAGPAQTTSIADGWTMTGALTRARLEHTATLLASGRVLVSGGCTYPPDDTFGCVLASAEFYDPTSRTWSLTGTMTAFRIRHQATLLPSGKVLAMGGQGTSYGIALASAEVYDPANGEWQATGTMTMGREGHTATLLPTGKVLVTGGYGTTSPECAPQCGFIPLATAETYDPALGSWTTTGTMGTPRPFATATLLPSGKVLVAGGGSASAELYDPANGQWTTTGTMSTARARHTATLLPNGKVLVVGGGTNGTVFISTSAELYDPATGLWAKTGALATDRFSSTATLLPRGQVLVAGGYNPFEGGNLTSAALYDPVSGLWTPTDSLNMARGQCTATLLRNGEVVIAGGNGDADHFVLATAETIFGVFFADDPLQTGNTPIKAAHITEIRQYIDSVRTRHGLATFAWTDSTLVAGVTVVRAIHITELRAALHDVYVAAGRLPPTYTPITPGVVANATHVAEVRMAITGIY